ncbi:MAG TPA: hypothetical protein VF261_02585 [Candidatus Saccharimonadales bacterium]
MRKHVGIGLRLLALVLADIFFFGYIDPVSAYAVVVILGFVLLVVNVYVLVSLVLSFLARLLPLGGGLRKRLKFAVTGFIGALVAMQSIGQLTLKDMFAIVPLLILLAFYLSYQHKEQSGRS